jgi:hypothetical protein
MGKKLVTSDDNTLPIVFPFHLFHPQFKNTGNQYTLSALWMPCGQLKQNTSGDARATPE